MPVDAGGLSEELARRELGQAAALRALGDLEGSRTLAEAARRASGPLRARALVLLGDIAWIAADPGSIASLELALEARLRPLVALQVTLFLAVMGFGLYGLLNPTVLPAVPKAKSQPALGLLFIGAFCLGLLIIRAVRTYLLTRRNADLTVALGCAWLEHHAVGEPRHRPDDDRRPPRPQRSRSAPSRSSPSRPRSTCAAPAPPARSSAT